jgi:hypothetical protein
MVLVEGDEQSRAGNRELGLAGLDGTVRNSSSDHVLVTVLVQDLIVLRVTHRASGPGLVAQLTRNRVFPGAVAMPAHSSLLFSTYPHCLPREPRSAHRVASKRISPMEGPTTTLLIHPTSDIGLEYHGKPRHALWAS